MRSDDVICLKERYLLIYEEPSYFGKSVGELYSQVPSFNTSLLFHFVRFIQREMLLISPPLSKIFYGCLTMLLLGCPRKFLNG